MVVPACSECPLRVYNNNFLNFLLPSRPAIPYPWTDRGRRYFVFYIIFILLMQSQQYNDDIHNKNDVMRSPACKT